MQLLTRFDFSCRWNFACHISVVFQNRPSSTNSLKSDWEVEKLKNRNHRKAVKEAKQKELLESFNNLFPCSELYVSLQAVFHLGHHLFVDWSSFTWLDTTVIAPRSTKLETFFESQQRAVHFYWSVQVISVRQWLSYKRHGNCRQIKEATWKKLGRGSARMIPSTRFSQKYQLFKTLHMWIHFCNLPVASWISEKYKAFFGRHKELNCRWSWNVFLRPVLLLQSSKSL